MRYQYFSHILRGAVKNKVYTLINILGLSTGLVACTLTYLYIKDELNYDLHLAHGRNVFRVVDQYNAQTPIAVPNTLESRYPEITGTVSLTPTFSTWLVRVGESTYYEDRVYRVEGSIFEVFTIQLLKGNADTALNEPYSAVISESTARKYFGSEDPMGRTLIMDEITSVTIRGVMADFPPNTHFSADLFITWWTPKYDSTSLWAWYGSSSYTYLRLADRDQAPMLAERLQAYFDSEIRPRFQHRVPEYQFSLQPVASIHLYSDLPNELEQNASVYSLYTLSTAAILLLCVACVNFVNLSFAQSTSRTREIGLRKTFGASRFDIVSRYLYEAFAVTGFVLLLSILIVELTLPGFNLLTGKKLSFGLTEQYDVWLCMLGLSICMGIVSGGVPALILSAHRPMTAIRNELHSSVDFLTIRRVLVLVQLSVSTVLIVCSSMVYSQLQYINSKPLGFDKENVIVVPLILGFFEKPFMVFQDELVRFPFIVNVSTSEFVPGRAHGRGDIAERLVSVRERGLNNDNVLIKTTFVERDFFNTLGISLVHGSFFSSEYEKQNSFYGLSEFAILNEMAVKRLGFASIDDVVDHMIDIDFPNIGPKTFKVVGVVQDFYFHSLHRPVEPVVFLNNADIFMTIRFEAGTADIALENIRRVWESFFPDILFTYTFLEEDVHLQYIAERRLGWLLGICALMALILACIGLFGLVSFMMQRRTKTIGIRKVLGASDWDLVIGPVREFAILVLIAILVAWPVALYIVNFWLQDFAYRIVPGIGVFVLAGTIVLAIATITIGTQVFCFSRRNPVSALRYE